MKKSAIAFGVVATVLIGTNVSAKVIKQTGGTYSGMAYMGLGSLANTTSKILGTVREIAGGIVSLALTPFWDNKAKEPAAS